MEGGREVGKVIRVGGVTRLSLIWSPHLSCKRDQVKTGDYMDRRVTPTKQVSSPTWGPHLLVNRPLVSRFWQYSLSRGFIFAISRDKFEKGH